MLHGQQNIKVQDDGITCPRNVGKRICRHTASQPRRTQSTAGHWHNVV